MKNPIRLIIFSVIAFVYVAGCATEQKNRSASEFLLTTDKATTALFADLVSTLDSNKYQVLKQDASAGILILAPRNFSYFSGSNKTLAHQIVHLRQEGGSVKVRISYECNYSGDRQDFVPCLAEDDALATKVSKIESSFIDTIEPVLAKHVEAAENRSENKNSAENDKSRIPASIKDTSF